MLDLIGAYENYLSKVKQASSNTVASYMRDIRQYSDWLRQEEELDVVEAKQVNISDYLSHLEEDGRSGATVSRNLASLKNFYAYLVTSGFLEKTPVTDIRIARGEKKLPQILTSREIELLLAQPVCSDAKGYRDKAMLEVMYATGIRVTELIDLDVSDVNLSMGVIKCAGGKKSQYYWGFVNISAYIVITLINKYYGEVMLNALYYLPTQFIGLWAWSKHYRQQEDQVEGLRMDLKHVAIWSVCSLAGIFLYKLVLDALGGNATLLDSMSTVFSIVANALMVLRYREQWGLWIIVDVVTVIMWAIAGDFLMTVMWSIYLINAIYGLIMWSRMSKTEMEGNRT